LPRRTPKVTSAHEFLEITHDFVDPKDAIREAISNAMDWKATKINVKVTEDRNRADEELIIEFSDNGSGLDEERLEAFFDLGKSINNATVEQIGNKGHGTKTYYNSRQIEVESKTATTTVRAAMDQPLQNLMNAIVPPYEYDISRDQNNSTTGTTIRVYGYNMNQRKPDFGHSILKDYILWKTKFGSVEKEFGVNVNARKIITLQGLDKKSPEPIRFGHVFASQNHDLNNLRATRPEDWTKVFCKRWVFPRQSIIGHPGKYLDMVFYIEGDEAKRSYNKMITGRGRAHEYGMYKVEDRYGLWVCKDYIPIKQVNEWLGLGKRLETKYHAFVNCQDLRLTANRGDIGNTPPDLLKAIADTVKHIYEENIIGSNEFQEYEEAAELEEQYQTSAQERKDFERRRRRAMSKKVCSFHGIELIEPTLEMGVVSLFNLVRAHEPSLFPFRVIDYDTKRGYDALVSQSVPADLSRESMFFVEFKFSLKTEFNHAFAHLASIVCWDCGLSDGSEITDIENKRRVLRVTPPQGDVNYTRYMLVSSTETHNVEVFVLKEYLKEKLNLEFRTRTAAHRSP
jgi:hypothetical protein